MRRGMALLLIASLGVACSAVEEDNNVAVVGHTGPTTTVAATAPAPSSTTRAPSPSTTRPPTNRSSTVATSPGGGVAIVNSGSESVNTGNNTAVGPGSATVTNGPATAVGNSSDVRVSRP